MGWGRGGGEVAEKDVNSIIKTSFFCLLQFVRGFLY